MELLAVLLALFVLATPALAVYAVWRQHKLRRQLEDLAQLNVHANDALHRELLNLRRQVTALSAPSAPAESAPAHSAEAPQHVPPVTSHAVEKVAAPAGFPLEPAREPLPSKPVATEKPQVAADRTQPALCAWCGTIHVGGVSNCPKPESPTRPSEAHGPATTPVIEKPKEETAPAVRESIPAAPSANKAADSVTGETEPEQAEPPASLPHAAESVAPASLAQPPGLAEPASPTKSVTPPAPPRAEADIPPPPVAPPPPAARVVAPPQFASLRASSLKPTAQQRMKSVFALEETLGTNWLNKIGIAILVLGVALFGIYELGQLGPLGKVLLSYTVSFVLLGGGIFFENASATACLATRRGAAGSPLSSAIRSNSCSSRPCCCLR